MARAVLWASKQTDEAGGAVLAGRQPRHGATRHLWWALGWAQPACAAAAVVATAVLAGKRRRR
jgi:hypothetical protein